MFEFLDGGLDDAGLNTLAQALRRGPRLLEEFCEMTRFEVVGMRVGEARVGPRARHRRSDKPWNSAALYSSFQRVLALAGKPTPTWEHTAEMQQCLERWLRL